jgi:hypothetical protein
MSLLLSSIMVTVESRREALQQSCEVGTFPDGDTKTQVLLLKID